MLDYMINPIKMGGLVKEVSDSQIKVHLHGRLGVITVPKKLVTTKEKIEPGHEMEFYFSYIKVVENPYDYDSSDMVTDQEIMDKLGTVAVPRRWYFTDIPLKEGSDAEFYFSCMNLVGKRDIPVESI